MFARRWKAKVGDKLAFDGHDWMSFQQLTTLPSAFCFISFSSPSLSSFVVVTIALIPIRFKHSNNIREIISTANCFNRLHYNINCISPPSVALHEVIKRVGRKTSKMQETIAISRADTVPPWKDWNSCAHSCTSGTEIISNWFFVCIMPQ